MQREAIQRLFDYLRCSLQREPRHRRIWADDAGPPWIRHREGGKDIL